MVQNQFRREKGKGLTKQKALHDNVNSLNVPTSLVVYFFALVFLCTLCPCISVNRINTRRLVISIQYNPLLLLILLVFIIKVQNIYYGSYRKAFCMLADLICIDYVPKCKNYIIRVGNYKNNVKSQIFILNNEKKAQRYFLSMKHE